MFLIVLICVLNLAVSWWNARICGMCWVETKAIGGFPRLIVWCAAIQSAIGFMMVILFAEAGIAALTPIGPFVANQMISLGYLAIIFPAIGTGLILTIHSWMEAYKSKDIKSIGTAAYNTITMAHNISGMGQGVGSAFNAVSDMFEDEDSATAAFVIVAVAVALGGGIVATMALIEHYKCTMSLPFDEIEGGAS